CSRSSRPSTAGGASHRRPDDPASIALPLTNYREFPLDAVLHGTADMKIVMVLTSHDQLGDSGRKTGFWLEEFAAPYFVFKDAGADLTLASPKGGQPPIDPKSDLPRNQTSAMARFKRDAAAQKALAHTVPLADVKAADYDTVFYVGGHGPLWD